MFPTQEVKPKHKRGELLIFIVFTLLYTLAVLFGRPTEVCYFARKRRYMRQTGNMQETYYLRQNIISQLVSVQWKNIVEADQFYDYIRTDFVEKITPDPSEYASMSIESRRTIMGYNLIVGAIQVRQVRIDSEACDAIPPGMETVLSRCYGSYSASGQSQNSFGPPGEEGKYTFSERGGALRPLTRGELGSYPASGYIEPLSLNRTRTIELVDQLQADGWISDKTRAIFIEFSLYNPNVNQFLTVRLLGEIPQSGGIITSFAVNSIRVFRYLSTISIGIAVVELLFVAMLIYFMVSEIIAFARLRKQYFKSRWNILDWINLLLLWVTVIIRIVVLVTSMEITIDLTSEETLDLERISSLMDFEAQIASLNIFFIYFRLFEYIADVPRMDQLFRTLARAGIDLALFFIVFTIVFLAFALSFYTSFSLYLAEFRTIPQTIFTLFRVLLGDFDFENMYKANKILGPLLFFVSVC
uniref:Polycystin cation channel PKD1/PKD2 domain-containing protein n=1 Tax=Palpitomonas bilix TaxID=652834 RepID=A0A7S3DBJ1_9EUKA|mmetsp:Transcript_30000/g.77398  ORF Transcript_30000/g.77398 Transcript_30000/m.77398 type:complete len:471 (+) Transcript_30000:363-1775(+)